MANLEFENLNNKLRKTKLVNNTKIILNKIWEKKSKNGNKYGDEFKYLFGLRLFEYAQGKHYDYTTKILPKDEESRRKIIESYRKTNISSSLAKRSQRLTIGYNSLTLNLSPKLCDLSSKDANVNFKDTTSDHIIGVTLCAQYVKYIFQEGKESKVINWKDPNWIEGRIDYMCNNWLKDNLWLWTQCRITKDEHKSDRLSRKMGKNNTILDEIIHRANLEHYEIANIVLCNYNNITP